MKSCFAACLIALAILSCTQTAEKKEAPKQQPRERLSSSPTGTSEAAPIQFGFIDATGKRLLALDSEEQPQALTRAACPGQEMLAIRFVGRNDATEANTGRAMANNFDAAGGSYYGIRSGKAVEDTTCLMTDERFLIGRKAVQVGFGADKPDKKTVDRIAQSKKRGVKETWGLGRIEPDKTFYLVLFEPVADNALFSVVMATPSRLVFLDFIGDYKNEDSVWRVDDGGEVDASAFSIALAFDSSQGVSFMYTWLGAEGESIGFVQETGDVFRRVKTDYRYMSPG